MLNQNENVTRDLRKGEGDLRQFGGHLTGTEVVVGT